MHITTEKRCQALHYVNCKGDKTMKKSFEKFGLLALTGMLVLGQSSSAFAASKTPGSGKSELSTYNAELATQRSKLSELITESKELTAKITAEQKLVRAKGYMTKTSSEELAKLSGEIKAKRQELTSERGQNKSLRAEAKEARTSGDIETAKDKLILLEAVQEKQIKIREELVELLEKKLSYLESVTGKSAESDEIIAEIQTETLNEQAQTEAQTDAGTATEAAVQESTVEIVSTENATVEATETTASGTEDETVADAAAIEAALDDGAELEDSDY